VEIVQYFIVDLILHLYICGLKLETLCGIIGIWAKNKNGETELHNINKAVASISHRGPDNQSNKIYSNLAIGHARLSIIDTRESANQPMFDDTGRYSIVFNGEIYNYKEIRQGLELEGYRFTTNSDTEVLLNLLISKGKKGLERINGFFAFIFYDKDENKLLFARDRMGIKPLLIFEDGDKIILSSEIHSFFDFKVDRSINTEALNYYFRLTYIPAPASILHNSYKILPGQAGEITEEGLTLSRYYSIKRQPFIKTGFGEAVDDLRSLLTQAVKDRLIADVPLGTFLSGGIDSSIVSAIAARNKDGLETFSIGFEHQYFNESEYAQMAANHIGSKHHEFIIGKKEFLEGFDEFLNRIDEPFADSSAFAVDFLAKKTKQHVTVALSGDGADELFGGYRKHRAELAIREMGRTKERTIKLIASMTGESKSSRSDKWGDLNRKIQKLRKGLDLSNEERYFEWCSFSSQNDVYDLLEPSNREKTEWSGGEIINMNDVLIADQQMVLANDMLKKVDLMSMAHSLEVRTPFLDHRIVEFANSLPLKFKMNQKTGKIILKEAFIDYLPKEIFTRSKKGFEIPLQDWLGSKIEDLFQTFIFSEEYLREQGLFDVNFIRFLGKNIKSKNFGERIYLVWSLIVFQHWYNRYIYE
jgi:asparagine synthase (glutamine-hydrolysing)